MASVHVQERAGGCGCRKTVIYHEEDPEWDGYDSDMEEVQWKFCDAHAERLQRIRQRTRELQAELAALDAEDKRLYRDGF